MKNSSEMIGEAQNKFIESRRGECKKYTRQILKFLLYRRDQDLKILKKRREQEPDLDPDLALIGWVRAREIRDREPPICYEPTLFRLLKDLIDGNIIQREEKNPNEVYYRIPPASPDIEFYTYEELYTINNKELFELIGKNVKLLFEFDTAYDVLKRNNLLPEYEQEKEKRKNIGEGFEKWKERKLRESQIKSSSLPEPSTIARMT
jgi:hypothetical protein